MRRELDRDRYEALTFDCYGTLIDWLGGVRDGAGRLPSLAGCDLERLVRERDRLDHELIAGPYRPYRQQLAESLRRAAADQGREVPESELVRFANGMAGWLGFDESVPFLRRVAQRYRLVILSNVEDEVLAASVERLGVSFEALITAEQLRSYKPARAHFDAGLERLSLPAERVLHVACSLHHDVRPARALGWDVAFVNRQAEPLPAELDPTWSGADLTSLLAPLGFS